jgi:hypothetical protein
MISALVTRRFTFFSLGHLLRRPGGPHSVDPRIVAVFVALTRGNPPSTCPSTQSSG